MTIWLQIQIPDLTHHVNNTYAKLAPDSILYKKIKEIMRYTGGTPDIPFYRRFVYFEDTVTYFDKIVMFSHRGKQIDILKFI